LNEEADLLLRPWVEADASGLREAIDEDVAHLKPWLSWTLEEPATLAQTRTRLAGWIEQFRTGESHRYAITSVDAPRRILGGVGLSTRVGPSAHDIGYWIRKSAARRGIVRAAVSALVVEAFDGRGVSRLVIQCDVANNVSAAFARHLGFDFSGTADRPRCDGSPRPVLEFEMMRETWRERYEAVFHNQARRVRMARTTASP
jgi:RimJ/RimL family protein N-acetyltransferase